jgi:maltooligosyltrehalose trehalohydrolase
MRKSSENQGCYFVNGKEQQTGQGMAAGPYYQGREFCLFVVWAPLADDLSVRIVAPDERIVPMEKGSNGYWSVSVKDVLPGSLYFLRINGAVDRPDPASHFQPQGVHGPSEVVDHGSFTWDDILWKGMSLNNYLVYELHVGTFTPEGTFEAVIKQLEYLQDLGVTAVELMPVAQFSGTRNWGYDGVYAYAPQNSYGGPYGLKNLVNACHEKGMAVILDVVYNHLGPEGNYLRNFGPYFTDRYKTPWGQAINFDGPMSDEVRRFFIDNALYWMTVYHIDALRVDAIHGIYDFSASHFLADLAKETARHKRVSGKAVHIIAESDLNDVKVINPKHLGGYGLDAQWNDDFHHALHVLLTNERDGYYQDFDGLEDLVCAHREGFVYSGRYSSYRQRTHGNSSKDRPGEQLIVFSQNHDQVGNRLCGDRPAKGLCLEKLKLAAATVVFSPFIPLIFMGEEYGEPAPFPYFVSHSDMKLIRAVCEGRKREFSTFLWKESMPDPQSERTFLAAKLDLSLRSIGHHKVLYDCYRHIIGLRRKVPALGVLKKEGEEADAVSVGGALYVTKSSEHDKIFYVGNFADHDLEVSVAPVAGRWRKIFDSASLRWGGPGEIAQDPVEAGFGTVALRLCPWSIVLYRHMEMDGSLEGVG